MSEDPAVRWLIIPFRNVKQAEIAFKATKTSGIKDIELRDKKP